MHQFFRFDLLFCHLVALESNFVACLPLIHVIIVFMMVNGCFISIDSLLNAIKTIVDLKHHYCLLSRSLRLFAISFDRLSRSLGLQNHYHLVNDYYRPIFV